jgi:TetR/AcrR family transcriptional repressor of uid operon
VTAGGDPLAIRDRVCAAAYRCVARVGMGKTTVDDVARESGISRATIYRHFPGGRDELLRETVAWELARFFSRLADHVRDAPDLEAMLVGGLAFARRAVLEHEVLATMLATEPERLLPLLNFEAQRTLPFIAAFLQPYLVRDRDEGRLRADLDVDAAAEYLARGILSLIGTPGRFDFGDPGQVRDVVRRELLGGMAPARNGGADGGDRP